MYCAKCGKPLDAGARFCSFCGTVMQAGTPPPFSGAASMRGQLVRSRTHRMIAGVCGGFSEHYGWDLNLVRIVTAVLVLFTGLPLLVYVILWVVIPEGPARFAVRGSGAATAARERGDRLLLSGSGRAFSYKEGELRCEGVGLSALAEPHGTPLYIYSGGQIAERYVLFAEAFAVRPHTVCYSVKANSSLAILKLLAERGAGFDIVSGGELERVRRAAPEALGRVVFSGVGKQVWEIDAALTAGILIFNVEGETELALLAERAEALGVPARFALRVNPDVFAETHPYISTGLREHKFGVEIGRARGMYRAALGSPWLEAAGVSVHIGSQIRAVEPFAAALARVLALIAELRADGHDIRSVDVGGGLGIEYGDADFEPAREVHRYAEALDRAFGAASGLHLLLEPGRFLVAQAGALLTRVLQVKRNGEKTFVIVDAGINDLIRPSLYGAHHEILPVLESHAAPQIADIVGPVCESGDFFARDRTLPAVVPGDLLAILDTGAYGMSLSSNYNTRGRAAEVLVEGSVSRLIRRRETVDEMLLTESV